MKAKKTQIENKVLQHALDASSCAITIADATKKGMPLIFINQTFERLTGYRASEALGKNCRFLQGKDRKQKGIVKIRKALETKKECTVILRNYRKNGTPFWNELHLAPVFDSNKKLTHYVGVQTNVTDRVEDQEELKKYKNHLEDLVKERTQEINEKNMALQELIGQIEVEKKKLKQDLTANLDNVAIPMLQKVKDRSGAKEKKYLEVIENSLKEATSSFGFNLSRKIYHLSPREIEICNLIRSGLTTKEIASQLNVSLSTLENQRNSIRKKLGLSLKKINLTSFLNSL